MLCCWDIGANTFEAVHQTSKREKAILGLGRNVGRSRNMPEQALTEIQCMTQRLPISKFTPRKTL